MESMCAIWRHRSGQLRRRKTLTTSILSFHQCLSHLSYILSPTDTYSYKQGCKWKLLESPSQRRCKNLPNLQILTSGDARRGAYHVAYTLSIHDLSVSLGYTHSNSNHSNTKHSPLPTRIMARTSAKSSSTNYSPTPAAGVAVWM